MYFHRHDPRDPRLIAAVGFRKFWVAPRNASRPHITIRYLCPHPKLSPCLLLLSTMGLGKEIESGLTKVTREGEAKVDEALGKPPGTSKMLTPNDDLLALDNTAFIKNGKWTAEFVVSIFDRREENRVQEFAEKISSWLEIDKREIHWRRVEYLIALPREHISVDLLQAGGSHVFEAGPTYSNGIMSPEIAFPDEDKTWVQGDRVNFDLITPPDFPEHHNLTTVFAQETGWGVISGVFPYTGGLR